MWYLWEYKWAWSGTTKGLYHLNWNANDSSWNWNDWTASNVSWVWGKIWSWCASFNWTNSSINNSNTTNIWNKYTISAWFYSTATSWARTIVSISDRNSSPENLINIYINATSNTAIAMEYANSSWNLQYPNISSTPNLKDKWYNIVVTVDEWFISIYLNWVSYPITNNNVTSKLINTYLNIWQLKTNNNLYYFNWLIDEVIIENTAWSANKVKKQYTYSKWYYALL